MPRRYFENFPTIEYNGYNITNITTSAKLVNKYTNLPYEYYNYTLGYDERADQVSAKYYSDQYMTWLIYYANKIVDPYYDWFLSDDDFTKHLTQKYGSIDIPFKKIIEFRNNWYNDQTELSPTQFKAKFGTYTNPHSQYWTPNFNENTGNLVSYTRKISNNVINTNKLSKVAVSNNVISKVSEGDLIDIKHNGTAVGTAEVMAANVSHVFLKNVIGEIGVGYTLNLDSNNQVSVTISEYSPNYVVGETVWTRTNISPEEYIYWEPYTAYDMERTNNNHKQNIQLVQPQIAIKVADRLEAELNGRK